jgi:hypothetical protein
LIFLYVRDEIKFGFPGKGDFMKASQTIKKKIGQCNTKATLFMALCKAAGIPVRIHFSLIKKEIQKGLFIGIAYDIMPELLSHSWIEILYEGQWRKIDSFINDELFYLAGKNQLKKENLKTGYSLSCAAGESSADFNLETEKFVQMDAVVDDHGVWDEPFDYYSTEKYKNRPNFVKLLLYRFLIIGINKKISLMRNSCISGLCR